MSASLRVPTLIAALTASAHAAAADPDDERLRHEVRPADVLRLALARNPDLAETRARTASARARAGAAARLPELQLKYEQWGVPLRRPWDLSMADTVMVGISQTLPAPATLDARAAAARADADVVAQGERARRQEIAAQVRRAFAEYYRTDRQLRLHQEHADLTARLVELARGAYRAGASGQQDVLRLSLELSRVHGQLAHMEPERRAAQALLNALMNRPPDAPLGPPAELAPVQAAAPVEAQRPEVAAARKAVERSEAALALANASARWPSLMLGVDYMYMPLAPHAHGYGAMVAIDVPWLSPGRRDEVRAAEQALLADRRALESVRNSVRFAVVEAQARLEAARASYEVLERDVLTQAQRNFEAARAAYGAGRGDALGLLDALRSYLEVRVDRVRALAHLEEARADLARAAGEEVAP